jgi:hypothetical protein
MLNIGYIELANGKGVTVRVYYDATFTPVGPLQPLVDGPRGYCLDVTNLAGVKTTVTIVAPDGTTNVLDVQQGDPVTSGQGRSRTASQLGAFGLSTRGDVSNFQLA